MELDVHDVRAALKATAEFLVAIDSYRHLTRKTSTVDELLTISSCKSSSEFLAPSKNPSLVPWSDFFSQHLPTLGLCVQKWHSDSRRQAAAHSSWVSAVVGSFIFLKEKQFVRPQVNVSALVILPGPVVTRLSESNPRPFIQAVVSMFSEANPVDQYARHPGVLRRRFPVIQQLTLLHIGDNS